jgi:excisionase family DNA binding protein
MSQKYLSVTQAVERTGLSRTLLYDLINSRQIEALHVNAAVRIREDVLDRFIAEHTHKAVASEVRRRKAASE